MSRVKHSIIFVIDASVARAAGETDHPTSSRCRRFLNSILDICHRIVMNKEIYYEWKVHSSGFSKRWRTAMLSKKKLIIKNNDLGKNFSISSLSCSEIEEIAILKDIHLVDAALNADRCIVSLDDTQQKLLKKYFKGFDIDEKIYWINPALIDDFSNIFDEKTGFLKFKDKFCVN